MSSLVPLISIIISILSVSYSSSLISLDMDCHPLRRRRVPHFYGYVPNGSTRRLAVFTAVLVFSALHITMKVLGVALLATLGSNFVAGILGGDLLLFFSYKLLRNDFFWFLRVKGPVRMVITVIERVAVKFLADFTVLIQARRKQPLAERSRSSRA